MKKEDLVSIITPMYNSSKYVGEMIESVIRQTYENWELVIVDDCSTDDSCEVVNEYCKSDSRVKLIKQLKNAGPAEARNTAIKNSNGRFIAFLDSDDLWHSKKLEIQIKAMIEKDSDISCTAYQMFSDTSECVGIFNVPEKITYDLMLKRNYISCDTGVIDRTKIPEVVMDTFEKHEDYVTWLKLMKKANKVCGINEVLAYYRLNNNTRSSDKVSLVLPLFRIYHEKEKLGMIKSVYLVLNTCVLSFIKYKVKGMKKIKGEMEYKNEESRNSNGIHRV